jgi:hypothetical protein
MRKAPLPVRIISFLLLYMGVASASILILLWVESIPAGNMSVSFLTNRFYFAEHPGLFTALGSFFILMGIAGTAILLRRRWAYDLAICCSACGLGFFLALIFLKLGLVMGQAAGVALQAVVLGGFLAHLVRNRSTWVRTTA